jgi:Kef-type K+ transport system membrane component KefB/mannitol/fructose-specific phosphotransferase system IIA component (Ntr-type)
LLLPCKSSAAYDGTHRPLSFAEPSPWDLKSELMSHLAASDFVVVFLALAALLASAKLAGELVKKLNQPSVLGEIIAGILLGPSVLGHYKPGIYSWLFPVSGPAAVVLEGVTAISVVLFLLTAGIEIDLASIFRQGKTALLVSLFGMVIPFAFGFFAAAMFPQFLGADAQTERLVFALFIGTALSVSALPVVARILMDVGILQTEMGTIVMSSAMFDDLVGWILFSLILGMMSPRVGVTHSVRHTIVLVLSFALLMLTIGRWLIHKLLPFIQAHTTWPGGVLGFIFSVTLASAAFAEYAGIHAVFGAFITGAAVGESAHLRERTAQHIHEIVTNVFAPIFFASIGLHTNFVTNFRFSLTAVILGVACLGKLVGAGWGARLGGMDLRSAAAVGLAMNARGAMEMILGMLALQAGLIHEPMFVALVLMALITSLISAPAMRILIEGRKSVSLKDLVSSQLFLASLSSDTKNGILKQMCEVAAPVVGNAPERFFRLVSERERWNDSGWRFGVAVPSARIDGLLRPLVVVGRSDKGVDFNSRDGRPARLIVLILTPDNRSQRDLLADAGKLFSRKETVERALAATSFVELLAALNAPVS